MRNAQDDGGRMKRFIGALKNAWVPVLLIPACIWGTVFLWEYHRAFQVLVQNPPNINISWQHLEGYEVMPGGPLSTDPETMKDLEQYATEITRIDKSPVLLSQVVRFQFPYPVENIMLLHGGVESISAEPVIMPLSLGQNASMQRSPHYSNYIVTVKNGSSDMRCRIVILFRTKPYGWLVHVGPKSKADPPISPPPPTAPSYDPLHKYIVARESMNYEGQIVNSAGRYAAFYAGERGLVYLSPWVSPPPPGLQESVDWNP
jgi:hypothetical protein